LRVPRYTQTELGSNWILNGFFQDIREWFERS
jgi:hypothetical protein